MNRDYFKQLKTYLNRLRTWTVKIEEDNEKELRIRVYDRWNEKHFYVKYEDSDSAAKITYPPRPLYSHYYMSFYEYNATTTRFGTLCDVFEEEWYRDEEELIYRMKQLLSYYRPPSAVRKQEN